MTNEAIAPECEFEYAINYTDTAGFAVATSAPSLRDLHLHLLDAGYEGPSIPAYDRPGFIRGWVSAATYRYA